MNKLLALACAASALALATAAQADNNLTASVTLSGTVPGICSITSLTANGGSTNVSGTTVALAGFNSDGTVSSTATNLNLIVSVNETCHVKYSATAGALTSGANTIGYTVNTYTAAAGTFGPAAGDALTGPNSALSFPVAIVPTSSGGAMVTQGIYQDTVTFTVTPGV